MIKNNFFLYLVIFFLGCQKEINISEFTNDFVIYEDELRIEALILPSDNTAIVRIDKSFPVDENNLYDCIDNDNDWNYYHCDENSLSYESLDECQLNCGNECLIHLYICNIDESNDYTKTYTSLEECNSNCSILIGSDGKEGICLTDDLGEDGIITETWNGDLEPDQGENDGIATCGENNIDEEDEFLNQIHVSEGCNVSMKNGSDVCDFIFDPDGGFYFGEENKESGLEGIESIELISYGAWVPGPECTINFNNYESEYEFICNCDGNDTFSKYGTITASDTLVKPPIFKTYENWEDINNDGQFNLNIDRYDDIDGDGEFDGELDTLYSRLEDCSLQDDVSICLENLHSDSTFYYRKDSEVLLFFASQRESDLYQLVQYVFDTINDRWVYYHGHPGFPFESINNKINLSAEAIVAEELDGFSFYKYEIFTFSKGYKNYYQYAQLALDDPIRSNLRDANGNVVMGAFGSMSKRIKEFQIINYPHCLLDCDGNSVLNSADEIEFCNWFTNIDNTCLIDCIGDDFEEVLNYQNYCEEQ